jgi:hypothetical protein
MLVHVGIRAVPEMREGPCRAVPCLSRSVVSLSVRGAGFDPGPVNVGFVVDTVTLRQVLHPVLILSVAIIPPMRNTHSLIHHRRNMLASRRHR